MIRLGITGCMGSGKSTVMNILAELGAAIIDADKIGHQVISREGAAYASIIASFGSRFLLSDAEIDRRALGEYVFADKSGARIAKLNSITHPQIKKEIEQLFAEYAAKGYKIAAVEAALLFQSGMAAQVDKTWLIKTEQDKAVARIIERGVFSEQEARARLASQADIAKLAARADTVIINNDSYTELKLRVEQEYNKLF